MTGPKKRRILGCSFPVLIIIGVIVLGIVIVGLLAGPMGQGLLERFGIHISFPSWLVVEKPEIQLAAPHLFTVFGIPITNTILAGWITVIVLVLGCWLITRHMKLVPGRVQAVFESILGWIFGLCESVAGKENARKFFPVVCTIFLFVAFNAWMSLIPGYSSILITTNGSEHELLRGANTDLNTPLALAIVSFIFVTYYGLKALGTGWLKQYFNVGPFLKNIGGIFRGKVKIMDIFTSGVNIFVGGLEFLSMLIRLISFTFRLFGNMTAGEILVIIAAFLVPLAINWVVYGFEMLVGVVQALVFSILTLVFATMAVSSHEAESHADADKEKTAV
jgi:F-type H+-transporting ATPase subunit a